MNQGTTIDHRAGAPQAGEFMPGLCASQVSRPSLTEALVDPGGTFSDPGEVVGYPWFTREEKRTILLSWARDELLLEQVASRTLPELRPKSRIDAVIEALSQCDPMAAAEYRRAAASIRAPQPGATSAARDRGGSRNAKSPWITGNSRSSWRDETCMSAASALATTGHRRHVASAGSSGPRMRRP